MSDNSFNPIALGVEITPDIFPIEIVFHEEDRMLNTPAIYAPYIPTKSDKELPEWIRDEAFIEFDVFKNYKLAVTDVKFSENDSEENFVDKETPKLKCIRRGKIMVRVYGPEDKKYCNITTKLQMRVMQKIYTQKNWSSSRLVFCYEQGARMVKQVYPFQGNTGDYRLEGNGSTTSVTIEVNTPDCEEWTSTGGAVDNEGTFDNPCKNLKRKTHEKFREVLTFAGDISKRIKYWYISDPSKIKVIDKSIFLMKDGFRLSDQQAPANNRNGKISTYFIAKHACWGSIVVEYDVDYTLFCVLYDLDDPIRKYRVRPGDIVQVGFMTASKPDGDKKSSLIEQGEQLAGCDLEIDRTISFTDERIEGEVEGNFTLVSKVEWLPYNPKPITFFVTDKLNITTATFTPEINFLDDVIDKLPKMAVYERRLREGYIDHIEEVTFVDVMGNVTTEHLEQRDKV